MPGVPTPLYRLLRTECWRILLLVVVLEPLGRWWLDWPGLGLIVALLLFLGWHALQLRQFYRWLAQPTQLMPQQWGIWGWLGEHYQRLQLAEKRALSSQMGIINRARASVSALEEGVILLEGVRLEWWNPAAGRLLGIKDSDWRQNILSLIRHPDFISYFQQEQPSSEGITLRSMVNPGQILQCELTRFGHDDRLMIIYNVTRLHQLERMRKDFVANISHELRTPLTVVSGYLETLLDQDGLPPRLQRVYLQMQQQSSRMTHLLDDLLLLSRLENDHMPVETRPVDMPALLNRLFDEAQAYNLETRHTLSLDIDCDHVIMGAEKELRSAFFNLVTNAIKYTPANGHIRLRWYENRQGEAVFSVQDNGIGIDEEHLPRLTERFYRVDPGRSRETGGTGLGLAIVKHVLLQHEAYLSIQSVVKPAAGHGTTFSCHFPPLRPPAAGPD